MVLIIILLAIIASCLLMGSDNTLGCLQYLVILIMIIIVMASCGA